MTNLSLPEEHKLHLEVFEGPLDLLLYLIKKNEVEITDIPISTIADQYMEYLDLMRMLDLNIAGEFLVMAATLMLIKSRMLLPPDQRPEGVEEEEEDPRWELVRQLIEYRKFKEAASFLQQKEAFQENIFAQGSAEVEVEAEPGLHMSEVSLFDLIAALNTTLKRLPTESLATIFATTLSVSDKIEAILNLLKTRKSVPFSGLFEGMATRQEIVCAFLALLELIRLRQINVAQELQFGEIAVNIVE